MAAVQGPFPTLDDPSEAVAAAMFRLGVEPGQVEVRPLADTGTRAWRWNLATEAPEVVMQDVLVFETMVDQQGRHRATGRAHHPKLTCGVVICTQHGFFVVADDEDESIEDLIAAGMREAQTTTRARRRTR